MKWFIYLQVLFFFTVVFINQGAPALTKAGVEDTKKLMKNLCKRNSGVRQDLLTQIKSGVFTDDPKLKCYIHCVLGMMKTMKKDKITVAEATKQVETLLPVEMREPTLRQLNSCKDVGGSDACDIAFNFAQCSYKVEPTNMLIPS